MNTVKPESIEYLWEGRIARGKLHLPCGIPGIGKSFVCTVDIPAHITTGRPWPDGVPAAPIGDVLILAAEDGLADTLRPRYDAAGADTSKIHVVQARRTRGEDGEYESQVDLGRDIELIDELLESRPEISLVVIDPLTEFLGNIDGNSNVEVRSKITPLVKLAEKRNVALLGVTHFNKGTQGPALYRAMGSIAFVAVARIAWAFVRDHEDADRVLVLPLKCNIGKSPPGLAFRIVDGRVEWEDGPVHTSADEALEPPKPRKCPNDWAKRWSGCPKSWEMAAANRSSSRPTRERPGSARQRCGEPGKSWASRHRRARGMASGTCGCRQAPRARVHNIDDDDERDEGLDGSQALQAPHGSQGGSDW